MIVCKQCGNHNEDGTQFCTSCGAFLEWTGERISEPDSGPPPAEPVEEEPTAPGPPATEPFVPEPPTTESFTLESAEVVEPPAPEPPAVESFTLTPPTPAPPEVVEPPAPAPPEVVEPAAPEPPVAEPAVPKPPAAVPPARVPTPAPPAPTPPAPREQPPEEQPREVLPGEEFRRPAPKVTAAPEEGPRPGETVCPQCGIGNEPSRTFCRRCGASLAGAVVSGAVRIPWWRRIFRRKPKAPVAAGTRPMRKGEPAGAGKARGAAKSASGKIVKLVALLAVVGLLVGALGPWRQKLVCLVHETYTVVHPIASTGNQLASHPTRDAIDGNTATYWAAWPKAGGAGQTIAITFAEPTDLARLGLTLGAQAQDAAKDFLTLPRPAKLRLTFLDTSGKPIETVDSSQLEDKAEFQVQSVSAEGVKALRIAILSVYPAQKGGGSAVAITELEFWSSACVGK